MPLIYSFVARGTTVLCDYTAFSGNFSTVAIQCLQKLPEKNSRFTFTCDRHTFNFVVDDGYTYLAVADEEFGRQIPFAFLEKIKGDFSRKFGLSARTAVAHSLQDDFGPTLRQQMKYYSEHPEEVNKVAAVQQQVAQVKNIMMDNIEKVLDRGEKIELLVDKTEVLKTQADTFHRTGRTLRRKMWWQNIKMYIIIFIVVIVLVFIIFLFACKGFSCTKSR